MASVAQSGEGEARTPHIHTDSLGSPWAVVAWVPPRAGHMQSFETGPICGAQVPKNSYKRKS